MESDWDELARIPVPAPSLHGLRTIATVVAFDDVMELLWAGNEYVSFVISCCWNWSWSWNWNWKGLMGFLIATGENYFVLWTRSAEIYFCSCASCL